MIIGVAQDNKSRRPGATKKEKEMGKELYDSYLEAKNAVKWAKEWNDLPNGRKYQTDSMSISIAHCKAPMLMRAGQQCCGGKNYWESPKELNEAILNVIIMEQKSIITKAILILERKEHDRLVEIQKFVDELQEKIKKTQEDRTSCAQGSATRDIVDSAEYSMQQAQPKMPLDTVDGN